MTAVDLERLVPRVFLATPFRLFAIYIWIFCTAVAGVFIYANMAMQGFLTREAEAAVHGDFEVIAAQYGQSGLPGLIGAVTERSTPTQTSLYLLTDGLGRHLAGNLDAVSTSLWNTQGDAQFAYRNRSGEERQAFGIVARLPGDLHLIVARDTNSQESLKRLLRTAFLIGYGVIIIVGITGGIILSRRVLRRVDAASNAAHAIMQGNLARRIPVTGRNDEFERLSKNLNAMLDRIQDLMTGLKDVSDNIAHDLKTPLHRLRTRAERALQSSRSPEKLAEALGSVIEEADALIQTFDALLSIARLQAGSRSENFGPFNVCALLRDVADLYEPVAEESGLTLQLGCIGDVVIAGEKHLIGQALANLLDNAIKYGGASREAQSSPAQARSIIEVGLKDNGDTIDITVADCGQGIPEKDRERVLQRFVRLQPSRSIPGSGLGLSLVAAVTHLHGGTLSLEDNKPGLRVRLTLKKNLPLTDDSAPSEGYTVLRHAS